MGTPIQSGIPRNSSLWQRVVLAIVSLLLPVVLSLSAVRLVTNDWFVEFEYRTPGFPEDPYGFTFTERLKYSKIAIDYLLNDAGIEFLGELRFPDGQQAPFPSCQYMDDCTRFYNDRELRHMQDVKHVIRWAMGVLLASLSVLLLVSMLAWRGGWATAFRQALSRGGWLTLGLIGLIVLLVLTVFDWLFILFHRIFFTGDTWLFLTSDSLIRLFPERFWMDTFLTVGAITAVLALACGYFFRVVPKKG